MDLHAKHDEALDEPQTPMWLPVLGIALFLLAGIYWATRPVPYVAPPPAPSPAASVSAAPPSGASAHMNVAPSAPSPSQGGPLRAPPRRH